MRRIALLCIALALPAWGQEEAFPFVDRSGQPVIVQPESEPSGKPLLLHFFATWCPDCADDLAHLAEVSAGCDRLRVYAVDAGDSERDVEAFVDKHGVRLPVLLDRNGEVWRRLDGRGLPMNAYWSAGGRKIDLGPKTREQWRELVGALGCPARPPS